MEGGREGRGRGGEGGGDGGEGERNTLTDQHLFVFGIALFLDHFLLKLHLQNSHGPTHWRSLVG